MGYVTVRSNILWAKHMEDDAELTRRILSLPADAPITLVVDGSALVFRKMRDGADGRATPGLRPEPAARQIWGRLEECRGVKVSIALPDKPLVIDPFLASLVPLLIEWTSADNSRAYDSL